MKCLWLDDALAGKQPGNALGGFTTCQARRGWTDTRRNGVFAISKRHLSDPTPHRAGGFFSWRGSRPSSPRHARSWRPVSSTMAMPLASCVRAEAGASTSTRSAAPSARLARAPWALPSHPSHACLTGRARVLPAATLSRRAALLGMMGGGAQRTRAANGAEQMTAQETVESEVSVCDGRPSCARPALTRSAARRRGTRSGPHLGLDGRAARPAHPRCPALHRAVAASRSRAVRALTTPQAPPARPQPAPRDQVVLGGIEDPNTCPPTRLTHNGRIVAMGDLHGDLRKTLMALKVAGVVEERNGRPHWVGEDTLVSRCGPHVAHRDSIALQTCPQSTAPPSPRPARRTLCLHA